ncbi:MAG: hypothetical protein JWQ76_3182 [Ramlibacter sp.]|nr:hypothetical protein [Ramlibacter sp.]
MDVRLTLTRNAERPLDEQYYLLQNDVMGRALLRAIRDAAACGMRVRILVDDLYARFTEFGMLAHSRELAELAPALAERVRKVDSFCLRLPQSRDKVQWVGMVDGVETMYDSEPGMSLGTQLQLLLLFPFVSESLLLRERP